jgi:peptidyl-prolyl cis-trans isomerase C
VRETLLQELRERAVENKIEDLTRQAEIERPAVEGLNPEILRNLGLVEN